MKVDFRAFRHLSRGDFWRRLWTEINDDHCWGMSAELSYYFLLAFFPFLIFLSAIIAALDLETNLLSRILNELNKFLPNSTQDAVERVVANFDQWQNAHVLLLWILVALWSASLGLNGMVGVLNRAYRVKDRRPYFKVRLLSILVTVGVSLFIVTSGFLLFSGDDLTKAAREWLPFARESPMLQVFNWTYRVVRWTLIFLFLNVGIQMVYFALPSKRLPWRLLSPGSVFATLGWLLGSFGFSYYVNSFADYQRMYGSLGDLVVLMVWFYFSSLFLVVGGEMDTQVFRIRRQMRLIAVSEGGLSLRKRRPSKSKNESRRGNPSEVFGRD